MTKIRDLTERFREFVEEKNLFHLRDKLLLAVSGGLDSVVMAELCFLNGFDFIMAHANFNLRGPESQRDQQFAESLGNRYKVPVLTKSFKTKEYAIKHHCSIQVAARELRYEWFREFLHREHPESLTDTHDRNPGVDYILTAHHQDDNIETLLFNFFKGTGIAGLHGILPKQGHLIRPLLFATKEDLKQFASSRKLNWVDDSSNESDSYTRNQIRHKLLPVIRELFPSASGILSDNIHRFGEIEILYRQAVDLNKRKLLKYKGKEIHIPVLQLKKSSPLFTLIHEIFKDFGFTSGQTGEIGSLLESESGRFVLSSSHRVLKNRQWLIISGLEPADQEHILINETDKVIEFSSGRMKFSVENGSEYRIAGKQAMAELDANLVKFPLLLRRWKKGDYFYPLGMEKKKKLSRFFIDLKLSQMEKENTWVLETQSKIIWVVGLRIDNRFAIRPGKTTKILKIEMRML